jgi:hypothetical protein
MGGCPGEERTGTSKPPQRPLWMKNVRRAFGYINKQTQQTRMGSIKQRWPDVLCSSSGVETLLPTQVPGRRAAVGTIRFRAMAFCPDDHVALIATTCAFTFITVFYSVIVDDDRGVNGRLAERRRAMASLVRAVRGGPTSSSRTADCIVVYRLFR